MNILLDEIPKFLRAELRLDDPMQFSMFVQKVAAGQTQYGREQRCLLAAMWLLDEAEKEKMSVEELTASYLRGIL